MKKIVVVGSMSMDLVAEAKKRPVAGETVIGEAFHVIPGGKGANQAVACARLGAMTSMIGCIGDDGYGRTIYENLRANEIDVTGVSIQPEITSGIAHIVLAENDNSIVVIPGANDSVTEELVRESIHLIDEADIVVVQLEIPLATVEYVVHYAYEQGKTIVLNPAPAQMLPKELIEKVTFLTPNEHECRQIFQDEDSSVEQMMSMYPNKLLITEGKEGVRYFDGNEMMRIPAISVEVVDTTGAGDTFNGGFVVGLAQGMSIAEAIRYGNIAAGLSVTKLGAQGGMPTCEEVNQWVMEAVK